MRDALFWWTGAAVWLAVAAGAALAIIVLAIQSGCAIRFLWLLHHTERFGGGTGPAFSLRRDARLFVSILVKHPTLILSGTGREIVWPGRLQDCPDN